MLENTLLFTLSANKELGRKVGDLLEQPVYNVEVKKFPSGEIIVEPPFSVRNKNIFIIQSTCPPVNENLFELFVFIDALKRSSAGTINLVVPYFGYARQDRKAKPRQPITSRLVADLLVTAGCHRIIILDLHAPQIQGFFNCLVDELTAIPLLSKTLQDDKSINKDNVVIVSPDHGGVNRVRKVAEYLDAPIAIIDKRRNEKNEPEAMNIIGNVAGKDCIMVDDMVDTAGSAVVACRALKAAGAKKIYLCATHPVFSNPAAERLSHGDFEKIFVTDSIPLSDEIKNLGIVKVVSLSNMIAEIIKRIENGDPLSVVYDMYVKVQN